MAELTPDATEQGVLSVDVVTTESEFDALKAEWEVLTGPDSGYGIFNSWLCNRTWWRHHAHLGSLAIYVARQHGAIVGIAPLYQRKTRRFGVLTLNTLLFIGRGGNTTPDDLDFIVQAENAAQISAQLLAAILTKKNLQRLYLQDLPAHSASLPSLRQLSDTLAQTHHLTRYVSETPAISRPVALLADDWPTFLARKSRNFRKQVKRRNNRLARTGDACYRRCQTEAEIEAAFQALKRLHQQRWTVKQGHASGSFNDDAYLQFHRDFMSELAQRDQLWLLTLTLDDNIIGVEYGFSHNTQLSLFQTGFSPAHSQLAPGHLMMCRLISLAIEAGMTEVDLLKGDYEYKQSYADTDRFHCDVDIVLCPLPSLLLTVKRYVDRLRSKMSSNNNHSADSVNNTSMGHTG